MSFNPMNQLSKLGRQKNNDSFTVVLYGGYYQSCVGGAAGGAADA
jgi:hypothetical protein